MSFNDWSNKQIGLLTVRERVPNKKAGYTKWRCDCACGGEIILESRALKRGTIKDCGCRKLKPGPKDLAGMRFGKLQCMESTGRSSKGNGVFWKCHCDCGKDCEIPSGYLTKGLYKSCGCLSHPEFKDLTNQKYGRLTAIRYVGKIKGGHMWECRCDCGNVLPLVRQDALTNGKTTSCGCLGHERSLEALQIYEGTSIYMWKKRLQGDPSIANKSGFTGVHYSNHIHRWIAKITFKKECIHLGSYVYKSDAIKARSRANEIIDQFIKEYESQTDNREAVTEQAVYSDLSERLKMCRENEHSIGGESL